MNGVTSTGKTGAITFLRDIALLWKFGYDERGCQLRDCPTCRAAFSPFGRQHYTICESQAGVKTDISCLKFGARRRRLAIAVSADAGGAVTLHGAMQHTARFQSKS
jgi:hypothetical protein